MSDSLLIVGNAGEEHVGAHLRAAARQLWIPSSFVDVRMAEAGPYVLTKLVWLLGGRRPLRLGEFSRLTVQKCRKTRPRWLLATGFAPLSQKALKHIGSLGILRLNYLTDDPWNVKLRSPWFMRGLASYDYVFSPRETNLCDLRQFGVKHVSYLPFGYSPWIHYARAKCSDHEQNKYAADIAFIGGADQDRVPYISALIEAGFDVALYGGYWERYKQTRPYARGFASVEMLPSIVSAARISLCLVRRANRDGHCMRTFELPAMGACILAEDTREHREIYGDECTISRYFSGIQEMIPKARWLLEHPGECERMRANAKKWAASTHNTYGDRLVSMLVQAGAKLPQ